jgi:hypothetical protein
MLKSCVPNFTGATDRNCASIAACIENSRFSEGCISNDKLPSTLSTHIECRYKTCNTSTGYIRVLAIHWAIHLTNCFLREVCYFSVMRGLSRWRSAGRSVNGSDRPTERQQPRSGFEDAACWWSSLMDR